MSNLVLKAKPVENHCLSNQRMNFTCDFYVVLEIFINIYMIKSHMCKFQAANAIFTQKHMDSTCTYMINMCSHVKFMCIFHKGLPHKIYINSYMWKSRLTVIPSLFVWVRVAGLCSVGVWAGQMVYRVPTFATDL